MPHLGHSAAPTRGWRDRTGFCGVDPLDLGQREHLRVVAGRIKLTHDLLAVSTLRQLRVMQAWSGR